MKKYGLNELRSMYLSFFESKEHFMQKSFPLVPQNDNSLLLINSGMAPLKSFFTGEITPPAKRMTSCQKCIRTPDIENVGKNGRHGTYFEMLGNFSFGDYFKREACTWAWEFIKDVLEMPLDKIYVSVYLEDDEAWDIWTKEIGVPESHMVRLGKADNFWEIGVGPCGPCSEIYFDRGERYGCDNPDCAPGCDCDRYVEFWNLVFTQLDSDGKGNYSPLEKKNIDTGMGLERLACIVQSVDSIFAVDTLADIITEVCAVTGKKYTGTSEGEDVSIRIITDHIRSTAAMICDGIMPSNTGRGYVLRRLLRRAARHGRLLGVKRPFLFELCETAIKLSEGIYPELREKADFIKTVISNEEERFGATIESGMAKLDDITNTLKREGKTIISGDDAFKLYDTYGFPIDLIDEIAAECGMTVDRDTFKTLMDGQRTRAKQARTGQGELGWDGEELNLNDISATVFDGYDKTNSTAKISAIIRDGVREDSASEGEAVAIVLDNTVFYAEGGGQTADYGTIEANGAVIKISDVKRAYADKFLHVGTVTSGEVNTGDTVTLNVDTARRKAITRAHSCTHLLQRALRDVLGNHVEQSGSLVEPDKIRFDFTHFAAMTKEQMQAVSDIVNNMILSGLSVDAQYMPIADAKAIGAMALFGEKYGDTVRVVRMGDFSTELCGGIHLENTALAGSFKIVSEASIAAGVRRIEAVCGLETLALIERTENAVAEVAEQLKSTPAMLKQRAAAVATELRELTRTNEQLSSRIARMRSVELLNFSKTIADVNVLAVKVDADTMDEVRSMSDSMRESGPKLVVVLAAVTADGKINFAAACGPEAVKKGAHAGNILKEVAKMCGGGGGGKPDRATAGGKDVSKLEQALEAVNNIVEQMVSK